MIYDMFIISVSLISHIIFSLSLYTNRRKIKFLVSCILYLSVSSKTSIIVIILGRCPLRGKSSMGMMCLKYRIILSLSLGAVSNSDVGGHGFPLFPVSCSFDDLDFTDFQQLIFIL